MPVRVEGDGPDRSLAGGLLLGPAPIGHEPVAVAELQPVLPGEGLGATGGEEDVPAVLEHRPGRLHGVTDTGDGRHRAGPARLPAGHRCIHLHPPGGGEGRAPARVELGVVLEDGDRRHRRVEGRPTGGEHRPARGQCRRHPLPPGHQAIGVPFGFAGAAVDGQNWFGHAAQYPDKARAERGTALSEQTGRGEAVRAVLVSQTGNIFLHAGGRGSWYRLKMETGRADSVWTGYPASSGFHDELIGADGAPRKAAERLVAYLDGLGMAELRRRQAAADDEMRALGITFALYDNDLAYGVERTWPFDVIPRLIDAEEWHRVEAGLLQRVTALNHFIADVYGRRRIVADGRFPAELLADSVNLRPACNGMRPAHDVWAHICGSDLVRDGDGTFRVLEDNLRVPSGVSYVLENRTVVKRVFPELFRHHSIEPVDGYVHRLHEMLASLAPWADDPVIVVLTPGIYNSAYFEHVFLATQLGVELVEGRDLVVSDDDRCYMRTIDGLVRVDVIYRRVDDLFLDPEVFRPDSVIGAPGLDPGLAGREPGHRQRARRRGGRRQGRLRLRARDDPLLPGRGAAPPQRARRSSATTRGSAGTSSNTWRSWWSSPPTRPAATGCSSARRPRSRRSRPPARRWRPIPATGSPSRWWPSPPPRPCATGPSRPATSTCGPSSSPAADRAT